MKTRLCRPHSGSDRGWKNISFSNFRELITACSVRDCQHDISSNTAGKPPHEVRSLSERLRAGSELNMRPCSETVLRNDRKSVRVESFSNHLEDRSSCFRRLEDGCNCTCHTPAFVVCRPAQRVRKIMVYGCLEVDSLLLFSAKKS